MTPFRWPRRRVSQVHAIVGDSRFSAGREQTFCDMNLLKNGYNRTVDAVDCPFCLRVLSDARAGRSDPLDHGTRARIAGAENEHGADETIAVEAEVQPED